MTNTLNEPILFAPLKQIRVSHTLFKVTSFTDFVPHLESFNSLEKYIQMIIRTTDRYGEKS